MDYTMYAIMVDGRKIEMCSYHELSFFENILDNMGGNEGVFVERFTIEQNNEVVKEKILVPKEKGLCLKKSIIDRRDGK